MNHWHFQELCSTQYMAFPYQFMPALNSVGVKVTMEKILLLLLTYLCSFLCQGSITIKIGLKVKKRCYGNLEKKIYRPVILIRGCHIINNILWERISTILKPGCNLNHSKHDIPLWLKWCEHYSLLTTNEAFLH